jgi:hypothetical protein
VCVLYKGLIPSMSGTTCNIGAVGQGGNGGLGGAGRAPTGANGVAGVLLMAN